MNMNQNDILKQVVQFNKAIFSNTFNSMVMVQDQAERTANKIWEQSSLLPKEGNKLFEEWIKVYKAGRESFRNYTNDAFSKVEAFLAESRNDQWPSP
jgi:hypothetical protein